jgi:UDP-N-acetylmuramoyl-tripeptide--D-alanyl-D-alanine ligase
VIETRLIAECPSVKKMTGNLTKELLGFCSDTRAYKHPAMFMAYPGSRHNPLSYVEPLLKEGCPVVIFELSSENESLVQQLHEKFPSVCFIGVQDAVAFTQELGTRHVRGWQKTGGRVFAISGSNGKTTHKEMLAFLLKTVMPHEMVATEKNNNNHLGVPLTLLQIRPESKICVLELGSNHPGEIRVLCDLALPDSGLVTNIGATHLEFFGTEEKVFLEEGYLYHAVRDGLFFQNLDDAFLKTFPRTKGTVTFSAKGEADIRFKAESGEVHIDGKLGHEILRNKALTGTHNLTNMATAWCIAVSLFPEKRGVLTAAASLFRPTANRSEWKEHAGKKIYLDAYNANPSSMKVALSGFFEWLKAHHIAESDALIVLGDMNELGDNSPAYHRELGEYLRQWPDAHNVFIGRFATHYLEGRGLGTCYPDAARFKGLEWDHMTQGKTHLFIKGSRSLQLESLLAIT